MKQRYLRQIRIILIFFYSSFTIPFGSYLLPIYESIYTAMDPIKVVLLTSIFQASKHKSQDNQGSMIMINIHRPNRYPYSSWMQSLYGPLISSGNQPVSSNGIWSSAGFIGQIGRLGAIRIHHVDFPIAIPVGLECDHASIWRPGR